MSPASLFKMMTGVDIVHIPLIADWRPQSSGGTGFQVMFGTMPPSIEYIRAGKLRALAVTTAMRSAGTAETCRQWGSCRSGYEASNMEVRSRRTPKNTPSEIVEKLSIGNINARPFDPKLKGAPCRLRRYGARGLARRFRQTHRRGNREVGQGG